MSTSEATALCAAAEARLPSHRCYEGYLLDQPVDLHAIGHIFIGGDGNGPNSALHPMTYFHHAGGDKLRAMWQFNNPQLRHKARA